MIEFEDDILSANVSIFELFACKKEFNISGVLVNRHYQFVIRFDGVRQMINSLEKLFNQLNFPMATTEERHFKNKTQKQMELANMRELNDGEYTDSPPNFILHVQFRQGSTWQGTLRWVERKNTKRFRSELELISLLMDAMELGEEFRSQNNLF